MLEMRAHRNAALAALLTSLAIVFPAQNAAIAGVQASDSSHMVLSSARRAPIVVGSAAEYAHQLQRRLRHSVFPAQPLFVADPAMNAIVVYDSTLTGSVAPNSVWPANTTNRLDGPVAVTAGLDCLPAGCGHYLWVSNIANSTVTAYSLPLTGGPSYVRRFRAGAACSGALAQAYGIAHAKARLYVTSEGSNQISVFHATAHGMTCPFNVIAGSSTDLAIPAGPSVSFPTNPNVNYVFNANVLMGTATAFPQNTNSNVAPSLLWSTGGQTEGTTTDWRLRYLWLTTSQPTSALWLCTGLPLPTSCPGAATIAGSATNLNSPQLPSTSINLATVFAPNMGAGTVTEYPESTSGNVPPIATFTGLVSPIGTAIENAPD